MLIEFLKMLNLSFKYPMKSTTEGWISTQLNV